MIALGSGPAQGAGNLRALEKLPEQCPFVVRQEVHKALRAADQGADQLHRMLDNLAASGRGFA